MQVVRLTSGIIAHRLDKSEQEAIWREIEKPSFDSTTPFFTPRDNLKYFVVDRKTNVDECIDTIKANGKTFKVKADICNLDSKTLKAVRKAYGK